MGLILFDKVTAASTSNPFTVDGYRQVGVKSSGVSGADVVNLQVLCGDNFQSVLDSAGAAVAFTSTNKPVTIIASGTYRVIISTTPTTAITVQAD